MSPPPLTLARAIGSAGPHWPHKSTDTTVSRHHIIKGTMTGDSHSPAPEGSAGTTAPGGCDISLYPLHSRSDPDYRQPSLKYTLPISQSVSVHWNAYYQSISQLVFTEVFVHIAVLINQSISLCWITHYSNQQGWEFAHWFSEQIAHFWWATSTICSWSLIFGERPEQFAHIAHFWWAIWVIRSHCSYFWWASWAICSHHSLKNMEWANRSKKNVVKNVPKTMILVKFFWTNCSFFVSKRANERFAQKKRAIFSFAHLSWAT